MRFRVTLCTHPWGGAAGTVRSPRPTAIQGVLGRLECDMFVLRTGLDVVPPLALLPALPFLSVRRDLKLTASHTNFSLGVEQH